MRKWGWGIALLGVLGVAVASAQPPKSKQMPEGWWKDPFGQHKPRDVAPKSDATAKKSDATAKKSEATTKPPEDAVTTPTDRKAELERLQNALMRRIEVCDRLREIAQATGNDGLLAEADRLEELAERAHRQQSARMGLRVKAVESDPLPESLQTTPAAVKPAQAKKGDKR